MVVTSYININSRGNTDVIDITGRCRDALSACEARNGILTVFNPGSTASLTTIEYEPNLVKDLKEALEKLAPSDKPYEHAKTWHDDNGHSHVRATLMGPSVTVPFVDGALVLGTWQQIVLCDFDTRPRERRLVVQITGE
ncbi:MAG: secondary thiamine-phosphate synthase enzyme YjbQ [Candidatus Omnitrophica bacterium]|nr:secondary thiamine-phosphate synthase enzyme YjbQ [Candidatus Omnitrophota bacterium]MDD5488799.1 secondary thiamine-phosphate synthase enzyme YjbQ [Candidatus Omnitrophota bacterium]